jgi:hypothetical protein
MSVAHETDSVEPAGPEAWSAYWDLWHWELSDPTEVAELERAELERCQDLVDAPPLSQVSPTELSMMAAHGCV